jgi:hypothetical protein
MTDLITAKMLFDQLVGAGELAVMSYDDEREEARQLLTKNMDKYLALEGVQRKSSHVLRLVRPRSDGDPR